MSARSQSNLPPLSPTLTAQNRGSMMVDTARSRQNSARMGSMVTGSSPHNLGMFSQRSVVNRQIPNERFETPWIEFAMEPLRMPTDKHPSIRAQTMRAFVKELFPYYSVSRRGGRVMQREDAVRLAVDLHCLVLNEGMRLFEHQLMRLLLKFAFNIDMSLLTAMTIPAVMDGKVAISLPPSEKLLRPFNLLARQLMRLCCNWLKETFAQEHRMRAKYTQQQMIDVAEVAWQKLDVGNAGVIKETQLMYYLQDVVDMIVPMRRYSEAVRVLYRDLEKLTNEYNTKS